MLRLLDLFSGIGGFSLAAERLVGGFQTVQFVESEPFCQQILRKHWPDVPIHDDITTFQPEPSSADVIAGGFPCQDISQAGKGAGIAEGTRSGLFFELLRVVRMVRPRYVVLENVAAITSNGLDTVLGALAEIGYDTEWACIRASDVGACHRRDRWWCVAYPKGGGWGERQGSGEKQTGYEIAGTGNGDGADTAYTNDAGLEAAWAELKSTGTEQRGELGNGDGADAPHAHDPRSQGREPASVRKRSAERVAWPGDPPGGRLSPDWRSYVSEPVIRRGDARLPGRVDRLKALGNAVVPQVAAIPLARVLELASGTGDEGTAAAGTQPVAGSAATGHPLGSRIGSRLTGLRPGQPDPL